jgi:hypothetical protein
MRQMDAFSNPKFKRPIASLANAYGGIKFWPENLRPNMNPDAIWRALLYIGSITKTGFEPQIRQLLVHNDSRVRAWTCFALGQLVGRLS